MLFFLFVCLISGILFLDAFVIAMIKYQAKAAHMDVEETKQGLVQFVVSGGPLLPEEEVKINWAAQSYQAPLCYSRVLIFTFMPETLERSAMCLSTSTFQSVAMKHSGRKASTSEHPSGGENSKGAGFTGRPGLGFLLLVFSEPRGRDGNNHPHLTV